MNINRTNRAHARAKNAAGTLDATRANFRVAETETRRTGAAAERPTERVAGAGDAEDFTNRAGRTGIGSGGQDAGIVIFRGAASRGGNAAGTLVSRAATSAERGAAVFKLAVHGGRVFWLISLGKRNVFKSGDDFW